MDWYRKVMWTKEDEEKFFLKLKRAQKYHRPQYLRIQAVTLYDTNNNELLDVALNLLKKYFDEYPDDKFDKSAAYTLTGDIYYKKEKYDTALENYENAIKFEEQYPNIETDAYIRYSELVIELNKVELFENVGALLLKRIKIMDFPKYKYATSAILSIISKRNNDLEKANYYKKLAEEAANAESSDFRWHKKLGLVKNRNKLLDKLMKE
jgi:tetratricopeptide (TPR) repeat protein